MNERLISSLSTEACIENQSICEHKFTKHREWKTFFIKKITAPFFISKHLFQRNIYLSIVWISCLEGCFWHQYMQNEMEIGTSFKKCTEQMGLCLSPYFNVLVLYMSFSKLLLAPKDYKHSHICYFDWFSTYLIFLKYFNPSSKVLIHLNSGSFLRPLCFQKHSSIFRTLITRNYNHPLWSKFWPKCSPYISYTFHIHVYVEKESLPMLLPPLILIL